MTVPVLILPTDFADGPDEKARAGTEATCLRCGHCAAAPFVGAWVATKLFLQLRDTCPQTERNFYVHKDAPDGLPG